MPFNFTTALKRRDLENRRRYHNPGKPRTAGLCGWEVVASDHLPLSCTFFRLAETAGFDPQNRCCGTAAQAVFPLEIPSQNSLVNLCPHRPHIAHNFLNVPGCHPFRKNLTQPLTGGNACRICSRTPAPENVSLPVSGAPYLVCCGVDFEGVERFQANPIARERRPEAEFRSRCLTG